MLQGKLHGGERMIDAEPRHVGAQEEALEHVGLSKNEGKVYLTLLELGTCNVGKIAEKSKLYRPNIYDALERLKRKGLVNYVSLENKKQYQASDPANLMNLLEQKQTLLKSIMPQLMLNHKLASQRVEVQIFEGIPAIRNMTRRFVDKKEEIVCFGIPKMVTDLNGVEFHNNLHKRRIENKVKMWHIYNADGRERAKYLTTLPHTYCRVFPYNNPVNTRVCGDEVAIVNYSADPALLILIKNEQMAKAYKDYFWVLWEQAQEL